PSPWQGDALPAELRPRDGIRGSGRGRYWDRTSDLFRVKEARYPCANRPEGAGHPLEWTRRSLHVPRGGSHQIRCDVHPRRGAPTAPCPGAPARPTPVARDDPPHAPPTPHPPGAPRPRLRGDL